MINDLCVGIPISRLVGAFPSRDLLRDYEPSSGPSFEALLDTGWTGTLTAGIISPCTRVGGLKLC